MRPPVPLVRARHGATALPSAEPPWDRVQYRIFHPATFTGAEHERQTGALPPDPALAPWPVLVMLNGINVPPETYRWLAERLATHGVATVTFGYVGEVTPGDVALTPGLDLSAVHVDEWGTRPSATTVGPLLEALAAENASGPLEGLLDLDRVVLAGHSAGGTVALMNARPRWFPGVRACVSYAGHSMPASIFGHPEGTILAPDPDVPVLLLGGSCDEVVAASTPRYGSPGDDHDPIAGTYELTQAAGSALAIIEGAGHLGFCSPLDPTTARGFLEPGEHPDGPHHRRLVADMVTRFCLDHAGDRRGTGVPAAGPAPADPPPMEDLGRDPLLTVFRMR